MTAIEFLPRDKARVLVAWLLGCCGAGYVLSALFGRTGLAAGCGVLAFAALAGYVVLAQGPAEPRLRSPLVAAALILVVVVAADGIWSSLLTPEFGWFSYGSGEDVTAALDRLSEQALARQRWWSLGMLVATGCLALAVSALPYRRRPWLAVVTGVLSLLMLGVVVADLVDLAVRSASGTSAAPAKAALLPLLSSLVALIAAMIAGQRTGTGWLAAIGAALLAVPLLISVGQAALTAQLWAPAGEADSDRAVATIQLVDAMPESATWSSADPWAAFLAATMLAGPVLVVVGCLCTTRGQTAEITTQ